MAKTTTRRARPEDAEFAFQTKQAGLRVYVERQFGVWDEPQERARHAQHFASQEFAIVQHDGEDVGVLALVRQPDQLKLNQLYIVPARRSSGIGSACLAQLIDEARALGVPLRLRVLKVNTRARAFYERSGFVQVGEIETHVLMQKGP
jgi:N-acetylglutamate synthase-like GNAT family acetyltransferase